MRRIPGYILVYVLWAVTAIAGALVGYWARNAWLTSLVISSLDRTERDVRARFYAGLQARAVDAWSAFIMVLALVVVVVFVEYYYRTGFRQGKLWSRFFLVTAIEIGVLFVSHTVYFALATSAGLLPLSSGYLPLVELALLVIFAGLYARPPKLRFGR